jgi:hypothetical protein
MVSSITAVASNEARAVPEIFRIVLAMFATRS